jgi:hypothetical protein
MTVSGVQVAQATMVVTEGFERSRERDEVL